ncbi:MAG: DUF456 domain-containing protein [Cyclobacteriaceae bacterium]|nr:DUF456 domain-containing protein [Cytophagales bacterium]MBX2899407.1 DUF456 domain-containing protein [Cyclobacteriaceae bacterium]
MDVLWFSIGGLLILIGIAGCFLPVLPGPPLAFVGLWIQQLKEPNPFTAKFLWLWLGITVVVTALDYWAPVYATKKFGGSKAGVWGCMLGLIAGFWMGPLGILIGPLAGAFIGELMNNQDSSKALRAAFGSFIGFAASTLLKLITCVIMLWYWILSW